MAGWICGRSALVSRRHTSTKRKGGIAQPQEIAAHHVEPFDIRRRHRLDENLVLDLLNLVFELFKHGHVVVDDEIEDGVEDEVLALGQRMRTALPMLAHRGIGGRRAVPHADDIALADEEMRFAEGDAAVDQLRGARDDEQRLAILLQLGALVWMLGILDCKVVQVELRLHAQQKFAARLQKPDPDDMALPRRPCAGVLDGNVGDALSA
jgi:hypothetical protein